MAAMGTFMTLALAALLVELAAGATYTVGGSNGGWDTSTDLQTWMQSQKLLVGDNLVFQYGPLHSVLEVSKADHDSCQTSNPLQVHSDGNTIVPLTSAGKRYFICGTGGHCSQGMKLEVNTLATSTPPTTSPVTPSPKSAPPKPSTPSVSPAPSPKSTPSDSPEVSPSTSPTSTSPVSPTVPSDTSPVLAPSGSTSPRTSVPQPSPSSANNDYMQVKLTALSFGMTMFIAFVAV